MWKNRTAYISSSTCRGHRMFVLRKQPPFYQPVSELISSSADKIKNTRHWSRHCSFVALFQVNKSGSKTHKYEHPATNRVEEWKLVTVSNIFHLCKNASFEAIFHFFRFQNQTEFCHIQKRKEKEKEKGPLKCIQTPALLNMRVCRQIKVMLAGLTWLSLGDGRSTGSWGIFLLSRLGLSINRTTQVHREPRWWWSHSLARAKEPHLVTAAQRQLAARGLLIKSSSSSVVNHWLRWCIHSPFVIEANNRDFHHS